MARSTLGTCVIGAVLCLSLLSRSEAAGGSGLQVLERVGEWSVQGTEGHCQLGKAVGAGQFAIGLVHEGTFLTFQDLRWRLPSTPTNMMPVTISLDGKKVLSLEALIIAPALAFQVFLWITQTPQQETEFWKALLQSHRLSVKGPFKPRAEVRVEGLSDALVPLARCASRYLVETQLPFEY